ncbi:MAG: NAD(P)-dependent oxidoreductase, partial [Candidatus Sumerlaeota bacterium]
MTRKVATMGHISDEQRLVLQEILGEKMLLETFNGRREDILEEPQGIEVVFGGVCKEEFLALGDLRWVHAGGTGVEGMMFDELRESDVVVTCSRGHSAVPMSEHMIAGMFYFTRDFPAFETANRQRQWHPDELFMRRVEGSKAVVLGVGGIGRCLAEKLVALGMEVIGVNSTGEQVEPCSAVYTLETVGDHLSEVEHVFDTFPATPYTRKAINAAFLSKLKRGATVHNVGRGKTIDESALLEALDSGQVFGAVLDVTDPEPPPEDSPLYAHPRVLVTGHSSWRPKEGDWDPWDLFCRNLERYVESGVENLES